MFYNKTSLNGKFRSNGFVLIAGGHHFHIVCHSIILLCAEGVNDAFRIPGSVVFAIKIIASGIVQKNFRHRRPVWSPPGMIYGNHQFGHAAGQRTARSLKYFRLGPLHIQLDKRGNPHAEEKIVDAHAIAICPVPGKDVKACTGLSMPSSHIRPERLQSALYSRSMPGWAWKSLTDACMWPRQARSRRWFRRYSIPCES